MSLTAALAALGAAACFGLASAVQHRAASREQAVAAMDPRLLLRLLRRPEWLVGGVADIAGTGLQALALRLGGLALVQPLLVSGLFLAILAEAAMQRRRPGRVELASVALSGAGLAAFLAAARPTEGAPDAPVGAWLGVAVGCAAAVALCLVVARLAPPHRPTALGLATGVLYAVAAALLAAATARLGSGPAALLTDWHLYGFLAVGGVGLVLNQNAFQGGRLAAPLVALTLVDPVVSVIIGVAAFGQHLSTSPPAVAAELAGAAAMAAGVVLAARSSALAAAPGRPSPALPGRPVS